MSPFLSSVSRRQFLVGSGLAAAACWSPSLSLAAGEDRKRFVFMILRGGLDGLHLVVPYGEPGYAGYRGQIAIPSPGSSGGALKLDGLFGLHPQMPNLHKMFLESDALLLHAVAPPYADRSHFTAQDILENGTTSRSTKDGWLGRALMARSGSEPVKVEALSLGTNMTPLTLAGAPSATAYNYQDIRLSPAVKQALAAAYGGDPILAKSLKLADQLDELQKLAPEPIWGHMINRWGDVGKAAGRLLASPIGPDILVFDLGGWDTHAVQGASTGNLAESLKYLDLLFAGLKLELGAAWAQTAVVAATEFGRTVRTNGTLGTDHGVGCAAIMAGGAIAGGRVIADWPGLAAGNLQDGRDLKATTDIRSVFKGVLRSHLGLTESAIETAVFPDSSGVPAMDGLIG